MKKALIAVICICMLLINTGCTKNNIMKADILDLAKKGENITWGDLKDFKHGEDIGSGLYIVVYPIDTNYELMVGGGAPCDEEHPCYAYLVNKKTGDKIDIMKENPTDFLK